MNPAPSLHPAPRLLTLTLTLAATLTACTTTNPETPPLPDDPNLRLTESSLRRLTLDQLTTSLHTFLGTTTLAATQPEATGSATWSTIVPLP